MPGKTDPPSTPDGVPPKFTAPEIALPKFIMPNLSGVMSPMVRFPELQNPAVTLPPNPLVESVEANYASAFYERLGKWINDFNQSLDDEHEVGARLVSFGQTVTVRLEDIGYWNPSLLSFRGKTEDGSPVQLIQHVTQISVLLVRLPRSDPSEPKRSIGFHPDLPYAV